MKSEMETKVFAAADKLAAEGARITVAAVRGQLGGGSLRDISPALRKWKTASAESEIAVRAPPPDVESTLREAGLSIWMACRKQTDTFIAAAESQASEKVAAAEEDRDDALAEISRLEDELRLAKADLGVARAKEIDLRESIKKAEGRVEASENELRRLAATVQLAQSELRTSREELQTTRTRLESAIADAARLQGQLSTRRS